MIRKRPERSSNVRFDLIPPHAERRLAELFRKDAEEFGERDWETGRPFMAYIDDARNAINLLMTGDSAEDYPARVCWAMMALMQHQEMLKQGQLSASYNDMPATTTVHVTLAPESVPRLTSAAPALPPPVAIPEAPPAPPAAPVVPPAPPSK